MHNFALVELMKTIIEFTNDCDYSERNGGILGLYGNDDFHNGMQQALSSGRQIEGLVLNFTRKVSDVVRPFIFISNVTNKLMETDWCGSAEKRPIRERARRAESWKSSGAVAIRVATVIRKNQYLMELEQI